MRRARRADPERPSGISGALFGLTRNTGPAELAGLAAGVYPEPAKFADNWRLEHRFKPAMSAATRERKLAGWARAVKGLLASDEGEGEIAAATITSIKA